MSLPLLRSPVFRLVVVVAVIALAVVGVSVVRGSTSAGPLTTVSVHDLHAALADEPTLIDVREPFEYADGHVASAVLMPLAQVVDLARDLPRDQTVYVICRSGNRSAQASEALVRAGFEDVRNVDGGMLAWASAGYEVVR